MALSLPRLTAKSERIESDRKVDPRKKDVQGHYLQRALLRRTTFTAALATPHQAKQNVARSKTKVHTKAARRARARKVYRQKGCKNVLAHARAADKTRTQPHNAEVGSVTQYSEQSCLKNAEGKGTL